MRPAGKGPLDSLYFTYPIFPAGHAPERHDLLTVHAETGAGLLQRWNLPDRVVEGVRHHHARPQGLVGNLERLVAASGSFARELGAGGPERSMSLHEAAQLVQAGRRPEDLLAAIDDEVTRRTAIVRDS